MDILPNMMVLQIYVQDVPQIVILVVLQNLHVYLVCLDIIFKPEHLIVNLLVIFQINTKILKQENVLRVIVLVLYVLHQEQTVAVNVQ